MRRIPEIAQDEALDFKEQALAIISEDYERIVKSGFLAKEDFVHSNGRKIKDFDDLVSQKLATRLIDSSSNILTAYDIDRANNEINGTYSLADKYNCDKSYIRLSLYEGEYIHGEITFSNTGDVYIQTFDKDNNIWHVEETEVATDHELFRLADDIHGDEFSSRLLGFDDITYEESIHYVNSFDINQFHSEEEYINDKNFHVRNILSSNDEYEIIRALNKIMEGEGEISYILLTVEDDDPAGIIAERGGNIFYSNYENNEFEVFKQGEQFNILGAKDTADKQILRSVYMYLDGLHDMNTHFAEIEEPQPAPEIKKARTHKPGM